MENFSGDVLEEAVELSEAVFSEGDRYFENGYSGGVESYILIQDIRNRIEDAAMSSGSMIYPEDLSSLPGFEDLGYEAKSYATVFYSISPDVTQSDLAEISDFSNGHISTVLEEFEENNLIVSEGSGRGKSYFYGENAFPYLLIFEEAELVLSEEASEPGAEAGADDLDENLSGLEEDDVKEEDDGGSLHDIMMDVAETEEDLKTTIEQENDGGLQSGDHTDKEDETGSNPSKDEYYEGW